MPTALLISAGRTDIQVYLQAGDSAVLGRIEHDVGGFHDALLTCPERFAIEQEAHSDPPTATLRVAWDDGRLHPPPGYALTQDERGRLRLGAPKLQPLVQVLRGGTGIAPEAVIVFATARVAGPYSGEDPRAVGPMLAGWLAKVLSLEAAARPGDIGRGLSGWISVLQDADPLTVTEDGGQQSITYRAADRIDDAIARLVDDFETPPELLLSTGGGIPAIKPIIEASARLRGAACRVWTAPEGTRPGRWQPSERPTVTALSSLSVRRQVIERVQCGDFIGAESVIPAHVIEEPHEQQWAVVVQRIAAWFAGALDPREADLPALAQVCGDALPNALVPALRTEAALVGGRWLDAVRQTATFGDVALRDAIRRHPDVVRLDPYTDEIAFSSPRPPVTYDATQNALVVRRRRGRQSYWRVETKGAARRGWLSAIETFDRRLATALDDFDRSHTNHGKRVRVDGRALEPRRLRNTDAHAILPVDLVEDARRVFEASGLWQPAASPSERFLAAPRVAPALEALGIADAPSRYRALVEDVRAAVLAHRLEH